MGIGLSMGFPPGLVAGAVISGALFGDKMSPFSDTTNLAPAMAGGTLFGHIRSMCYTTLPGWLICLVIFGIAGARYSVADYDPTTVIEYMGGLADNFNIGIIPLIPIVLVIVIFALQDSGTPDNPYRRASWRRFRYDLPGRRNSRLHQSHAQRILH